MRLVGQEVTLSSVSVYFFAFVQRLSYISPYTAIFHERTLKLLLQIVWKRLTKENYFLRHLVASLSGF